MTAYRRVFVAGISLTILLSGVSAAAAAEIESEMPAFQMPMAESLPFGATEGEPAVTATERNPAVTETEGEPAATTTEGELSTAVRSASWSLPMEGLLGEDGTAIVPPTRGTPRRFDASINLSDGRDLVSSRVDALLDSALANDPETRVLDKAVTHFRTATQRAVAEAKDTADYIVPFRGFGPSSEAGDIILGEKLKLKSRASAEYARQKHIDEIHFKVVSSMMQLSMGLGMTDRNKGSAITSAGLDELKKLVGEEQAVETADMLTAWAKEVAVPDEVYAQGAWDVTSKQSKFKTVMTSALDNDPVLKEVTRRLHKYNHRSKFARASAHVVETTLGAVSLAPDLIGPAAKAALVSFVMATGGPEQCKLLKELYLDKRFESRVQVLNEQAHLALENYQVAILTKNPVLMACSESVVSEMAGYGAVQNVFGASVLPRNEIAAGPVTQQ